MTVLRLTFSTLLKILDSTKGFFSFSSAMSVFISARLLPFSVPPQLAQLSVPDMRLAIQYALTYPVRLPSPVAKLDLGEIGKLEFGKPDMENFPCLKLAYEALKKGGIFPAVLNGANETAVARFLRGECRFMDIPRFVEKKLSETVNITDPDLEDILEADRFGRE